MSNESPCLPPPGTTKVQLPEFQNWLQHRRQEWRSNVNNNASAKAGDTVSGGVLATATPQPVQAPEPIPVPVPVKVDPAVLERMRMQAIQQQQMAIQQQQIRQRQVQEHLQRAREFRQKQEEFKKEQTNRSNATLVDQACRIFSPVDDQWHNATCKGYDKETMEHEFQIGRKETKKIDINKYMILWEKDRVNHKSDQYGLNEEQIRVCYDAVVLAKLADHGCTGDADANSGKQQRQCKCWQNKVHNGIGKNIRPPGKKAVHEVKTGRPVKIAIIKAKPPCNRKYAPFCGE